MTKHNNMATPKKIEPTSSGHECAIGFILERTMQYVKSFETFIDIGKDIRMSHISEVNYACVTNMDAMFIVEEEVQVSLN
jgi:predicted RNA-binding protein with RPS1 domain